MSDESNTGGPPLPELSVVVLCYRAEESARQFALQLMEELGQAGIDYELILVANHHASGNDPTPETVRQLAAENPRVVAITRIKRGMMGWDMRSGLDAARGDCLAVIDGDGQMPSSDVVKAYRRLREGNYDLVKTTRVKRHDGLYRRVISYVYNVLFRVLFPHGGRFTDVNSKPKVMTRAAYRAMALHSNDWFTDAEIMLEVIRNRLNVAEIPTVFSRNERRASFVPPSAIWEFLRNLLHYRLSWRRRGGPPPAAEPKRPRSRGEVVYRVSAVLLAILVGFRVLRYAPIQWPEPVDHIVGGGLIFAWLLFIFPLLLLPKHLFALGALAVGAVLSPRRYLVDLQRPWQLRPWLHGLLWFECLINHYLFDFNPYLALLMLVALVAGEIDRRLRLGPWMGPATGKWFVWLVPLVLLVMANAADCFSDAIAGMGFAAFTGALLRFGRSLFGHRERRLLILAGGVATQAVASLLPLALPLHGGRRVGEGMAYTFCDVPGRDVLLAAIPNAPTMLPWSMGHPHGRDGYVAEYRASDLSPRKEHRFFDDHFHGRVEWLECLKDEIQVGVTNITIDGRQDQDHALSFSLDQPDRLGPWPGARGGLSPVLERDVVGGRAGHGIVYDDRRDVLYYVSENSPTVIRLDRRTGQRARVLEDLEHRQEVSLIVGPRSIHRARDKMYITEWFSGSDVFEIDLESLRPTYTFPQRDGGGIGVTVDEGMNRLYVVGLWGMEVFDLESRALIARKRLGLLSRSPAIDEENGIVYVPSTADGKIRAFDRRTLDLLGVIPIGHGARIPFYSAAHKRLYSGSSLAHYAWDGAKLAAFLRGKH